MGRARRAQRMDRQARRDQLLDAATAIILGRGVVECGLFVGRSSDVIVAATDGVEVLTPARENR